MPIPDFARQVIAGVVANGAREKNVPLATDEADRVGNAILAGLDLADLYRLSMGEPASRLWPWSRVTGWRIIKKVMDRAGIAGRHACPKAFRHAFGIGTLHARIPINLTQRWLGHARISTTAIYAAACGPEEHAFAALFWDDCIGRGYRTTRSGFEAAITLTGAAAHQGIAPPTVTRPHAVPAL